MIPEFKFKKKRPIPKRAEIIRLFSDQKIRVAAATTATAVLLGVTALAIPTERKASKVNAAPAQTAGVATPIYSVDEEMKEQLQKPDVSISKMSAFMTGIAQGDVEEVSEEAIAEEIAAEEAAAAAAAEASETAVDVMATPEYPQIEGFSNPGTARAEDYVNIRTKPDESSEICGKLAKNAFCEVVGETEQWYEIVTNGVKGYIKKDFLITGDEAWQLADQQKVGYLKVITETLYVREQPSTDSRVLTMVSIDQKLDILQGEGEWIKVRVQEDGTVGYVNNSYIAVVFTLPKGEAVAKKTSSDSTSKSKTSDSKNSKSSSKPAKDCSSVVSYAKQFVGNPYVYGGTSLTKGTDCSGFTMSVYAKFGVYLPHSSSAQASCGTKVSLSDLQPGDLLFYGSSGGINHVALYIGGGRIVHASTEKTGIKISNAFYRTPVTARRVMR